MSVSRVRSLFVVILVFLAACSSHPSPASTPTAAPTPKPYGAEVIGKYSYPEPRGLARGFGSVWLSVAGDTLYRINSSSGQKQGILMENIGKEPAQMLVTADTLWLINAQSASVARIDPGTFRVTKTLKFDDICCSLAEFNGGVWTIDAKQTLSRIDEKTNEITAFTLPSGALTNGPFVDGTGLWVEVDNNNLVSFDPATKTFGPHVAYQGSPIGFSHGLFWTVTAKGVLGMDPKTGKVSTTIASDGEQVASFGFTGAFGEGQLGQATDTALWVIGLDAASTPVLISIDPAAGKITGAYHVGPKYYGFVSMLVDRDTVWLADDHSQLLRIQP